MQRSNGGICEYEKSHAMLMAARVCYMAMCRTMWLQQAKGAYKFGAAFYILLAGYFPKKIFEFLYSMSCARAACGGAPAALRGVRGKAAAAYAVKAAAQPKVRHANATRQKRQKYLVDTTATRVATPLPFCQRLL